MAESKIGPKLAALQALGRRKLEERAAAAKSSASRTADKYMTSVADLKRITKVIAEAPKKAKKKKAKR